MGYDFLPLHREPGQSWDEVLAANERRVIEEGDRALSPAARGEVGADRRPPASP